MMSRSRIWPEASLSGLISTWAEILQITVHVKSLRIQPFFFSLFDGLFYVFYWIIHLLVFEALRIAPFRDLYGFFLHLRSDNTNEYKLMEICIGFGNRLVQNSSILYIMQKIKLWPKRYSNFPFLHAALVGTRVGSAIFSSRIGF